ncbi:hypothetical protein RPD76_07510 [Methylomonas sp. MV1]|uniref:gp53-like domain-containing protein n=1 Tax=Methylomonas sp. MV1 TaxID=3073620 RepID=UPI0028A41C1E|nr:hypothetical protein [Methylomonas sp. MV1]MDT4329752.1 hypothetical protein [Methylomonas sp. MV1]
MHRIDGAGHVGHMFVAEDVATSRPPTEVTDSWLNAVQEEIAAFIEWSGLVLDKAANNQLLNALTSGLSINGGSFGFLKLPEWLGGFMVQWGYASCAPDTATTFSFNVPFSTVFGMIPTWNRTIYPGASNWNPIGGAALSVTQGRVWNTGGLGTESVFWVAIGK